MRWFILLGCLFLSGTGAYILFWEYLFFRRAIRVKGVVTAYEKDPYNHEYVEIVSFSFDGKKRQVKNGYTTPKKPKLGQSREVGINPLDIQQARVAMCAGQKVMYSGFAIAFIFGMFVAIWRFVS